MVQGARPAEGVRKGGEEPPLQKSALRPPPLARTLPKAPRSVAAVAGIHERKTKNFVKIFLFALALYDIGVILENIKILCVS